MFRQRRKLPQQDPLGWSCSSFITQEKNIKIQKTCAWLMNWQSLAVLWWLMWLAVGLFHEIMKHVVDIEGEEKERDLFEPTLYIFWQLLFDTQARRWGGYMEGPVAASERSGGWSAFVFSFPPRCVRRRSAINPCNAQHCFWSLIINLLRFRLPKLWKEGEKTKMGKKERK